MILQKKKKTTEKWAQRSQSNVWVMEGAFVVLVKVLGSPNHSSSGLPIPVLLAFAAEALILCPLIHYLSNFTANVFPDQPALYLLSGSGTPLCIPTLY